MKNILAPTLVALALVAGAAHAGTVSVGAEAFGGMSIPVLQDDTDQGSVFGARVPVNVTHLLTLEPWFAKSGMGDKTDTFAGLSYTRDGGDVTTFGLNARLGGLGGPGLSFFPYLGLGSYKITREGSADISEMGYDFGLGLTLTPMPKFGIGLRGEFDMVPTGDTSRKYATVTLGLSYRILSTP